ncbi:trypsin-like peptidase domain-containing protein, partial [Candidatus Uhrbacteria bacterium]|nr:trypsin-like peptidase domain-containing protein [Candidatus Uhrbacteria bacterium]
MDMEELSKSQIILLTLLVSFVTSIATGIVTVSLMDQAPPAIAQTVNRVVERTVEKIVQTPSPGQAATVITTEKTVVVKESDLIVEAVKKMSPSLVRIYSSSLDSPIFLGLGIIIDESGTVVTDSSILGEAANAAIALHDGTTVRAFVTERSREVGFARLKPATTTADGKVLRFTPAVLALGAPTLGQTVVALSGKTIPRIADGLVTALIPQGENPNGVIDTNISRDFVMEGSPLIDTEGGVIGVSSWASRASSPGGFISSS